MANTNLGVGVANYIRGSVVLSAGATFVDINLSLPNSNFFVGLTPVGIGLTLYVANKTTSGFRIVSLSAPISDTNIDYIVFF